MKSQTEGKNKLTKKRENLVIGVSQLKKNSEKLNALFKWNFWREGLYVNLTWEAEFNENITLGNQYCISI